MNETPHSLPAVLTFAATDPTSGAGLQADLLALASMGCYPLSVVTALTVQDTAGVESVLAIDPDWVADQARCILEDMPVAAFKMGMLGSTEIVTVVAEVGADYPDVPLAPDDAVYEAQDYTWQALAHAFRPGMGQHLPDRLFWAREGADEGDGK